LHKRSFWAHMKIMSGSIHTLRHIPDSDIYIEVLFLDFDLSSTMTGQTINVTGGQEKL